MKTWLEDIVTALENLGGQAPLRDIYSEVSKIREQPLPKSWKEVLRATIQYNSPDSEIFRGIEYFRKVDKGIWKISDNPGKKYPDKRKINPGRKRLKERSISKEQDTIPILIKTLKDYRDYSHPDSSSWDKYIYSIFHLLGFKTETINKHLVTLSDLSGNGVSVVVVGIVKPGNSKEEFSDGFAWKDIIRFAASFHQVNWAILTDGLFFDLIDTSNKGSIKTVTSLDLDDILHNLKTREFISFVNNLDRIKRIRTQRSVRKRTQSKKYSKLREWFLEKVGVDSKITLSFAEIEKILKTELPASARKHRPWWGNHYNNPQGYSWISAGWLVDKVDFSNAKVSFRKSKSALYPVFFSKLVTGINEARPGITKIDRTSIENWLSLGSGFSGYTFSWALPRNPVFRVELYIDLGEKKETKRKFDLLHGKSSIIEKEIGEKLDWDRIDSARASRISICKDFNISDTSGDQKTIIDWGVTMMLMFIDVFKPNISNIEDNHHNVYVISLDESVLNDKKFVATNPNYEEGKSCLYVGMTGKTPDERFEEHKRGYKSNKYAEKHGQYLRRKLYEKYNPMSCEEAELMEVDLAEKLRAQGNAVWQN